MGCGQRKLWLSFVLIVTARGLNWWKHADCRRLTCCSLTHRESWICSTALICVRPAWFSLDLTNQADSLIPPSTSGWRSKGAWYLTSCYRPYHMSIYLKISSVASVVPASDPPLRGGSSVQILNHWRLCIERLREQHSNWHSISFGKSLYKLNRYSMTPSRRKKDKPALRAIILQ